MKKTILVTKDIIIKKTFLLKGSEEYDLNLELVHSAPKIRSEVLVRGVLLDSAKARIVVNLKIEKSAIETETFFRCEILNLGGFSSAQVFPYLEIAQSKVKAGHSVSIRKIREEEMFFLESRGLSDQAAKDLIVEGFLAKI